MIYSIDRAEGRAATMDRAGRIVGTDRAAVAPAPAAVRKSRTQAGAGPAGAVRDPVRAVHRDPLGVPAPGVGFRVRDDVLAAPRRMARSWRVAAPARDHARRTARRGQARLVQGGDRRLPRTSAQGRPKTGPSPVDRAKTGSKHHVITDGAGIPPAANPDAGNRHDVTQLMALIDAIPS